MKLKVRKARKKDRKEWAAMRRELWPECPAERHELEVTQLIVSEGVVIVAEVDGHLAGFAEVSIRNDHVEGTSEAPVPYLEGWFVRRNQRGGGIGRALIAFAEKWAVAQGYRELASDAELWNKRSIRLHKKLGFREAGRSVHFVKPLATASSDGRTQRARKTES